MDSFRNEIIEENNNSDESEAEEESEVLLSKIISTELLCMELITLKNSLLTAIDPIFEEMLNQELKEYENDPVKMIDKYLETTQESEGSSSDMCQLKNSQTLYEELSQQTTWITQNALMIKKVFCPRIQNYKDKFSDMESIVNQPRKPLHSENNDEENSNIYSALWMELLCIELHYLKDAILVSFDSSLEDYFDLNLFTNTNTSCRLMDLFFDTHSEFTENATERLEEAEKLHSDLNEQVNWLVSNTAMIKKIFFPNVDIREKFTSKINRQLVNHRNLPKVCSNDRLDLKENKKST